MKTLVLLITLIMVFVFGYMVGAMRYRPKERSPITVSRPAPSDADSSN